MGKHSHHSVSANGQAHANGHSQGGGQARADGQQGSEQRAQQAEARPAAQERGGDREEARSAEERAWGPRQSGRRWRSEPRSAGDVMTRSPRTARATDSLQLVAKLMVDEDAGIIPVVDGGKLVGVVTDRDIVCRAVAEGSDTRAAKAGDVMTDEVECVTEDESLDDVLALLGERQVRRLPVVAEGDRLVGIISMADLAREADVNERLQETFAEISATRGFWSSPR